MTFVNGQPWGILGDIQLAGTEPASGSGLYFDAGGNPGVLSIQTRAQGTQANNVRLVTTAVQGTTNFAQVTSAANGVVNLNFNFDFNCSSII